MNSFVTSQAGHGFVSPLTPSINSYVPKVEIDFIMGLKISMMTKYLTV